MDSVRRRKRRRSRPGARHLVATNEAVDASPSIAPQADAPLCQIQSEGLPQRGVSGAPVTRRQPRLGSGVESRPQGDRFRLPSAPTPLSDATKHVAKNARVTAARAGRPQRMGAPQQRGTASCGPSSGVLTRLPSAAVIGTRAKRVLGEFRPMRFARGIVSRRLSAGNGLCRPDPDSVTELIPSSHSRPLEPQWVRCGPTNHS